MRSVMLCLPAVMLVSLAACAPDYSPNTYAANAVQQANKVEPGTVVGFRQVEISASGTVGAVTGGAAGGVLGSQSGTLGVNSALGAVGGTAIGSLLGTTIEHVTGDTTGWEYIVRKGNGELLSVTQREPRPIPVGQKVLVITGSQARILPDYSVPAAPEGNAAPAKPKPAEEGAVKPEEAKPEEPKPEEARSEAPPAEAPKPAEGPAASASTPAAGPVVLTPVPAATAAAGEAKPAP